MSSVKCIANLSKYSTSRNLINSYSYSHYIVKDGAFNSVILEYVPEIKKIVTSSFKSMELVIVLKNI